MPCVLIKFCRSDASKPQLRQPTLLLLSSTVDQSSMARMGSAPRCSADVFAWDICGGRDRSPACARRALLIPTSRIPVIRRRWSPSRMAPIFLYALCGDSNTAAVLERSKSTLLECCISSFVSHDGCVTYIGWYFTSRSLNS